MDELKEIVAAFVKKNASGIGRDTLINRKVVAGSVLIHRMYAAINNAGYKVTDYAGINTFGELLDRLDGKVDATTSGPVIAMPPSDKTAPLSVGIDIESVANFPLVMDYREDKFYQLNFSAHEISYCLMKPSPAESFAGLFAAKEALCKAMPAIRQMPFNSIEIKHNDAGRPLYPGFSLTISHTGQLAVAIAIGGHPGGGANDDIGDLRELIDESNSKIASLRRWVLLLAAIILLVTIAAGVLLLK